MMENQENKEKEIEQKPKVGMPPEESMSELEKAVWNALKGLIEPEVGVPIVDMGLIYEVKVEGDKAYIKMTLTSPFCPMGGYIVEMVRNAAMDVKGIAVADVDVVFDPPWDPRTMASEEVKRLLGYF